MPIGQAPSCAVPSEMVTQGWVRVSLAEQITPLQFKNDEIDEIVERAGEHHGRRLAGRP